MIDPPEELIKIARLERKQPLPQCKIFVYVLHSANFTGV